MTDTTIYVDRGKAREAVLEILRHVNPQDHPRHSRDAYKALREIDALPMKTAADFAAGWQPIETAPKDGSNILVSAGGLCMVTAHWSLLSDEWFSLVTGKRVTPTHWMPLPASPVAGEG